MKGNLFIYILLFVFSVNCSVIAEPKPIKIKINYKIVKHCDDGFGFCMVILGSGRTSDPRIVPAEAEITDRGLLFTFQRDLLTPEMIDEFEANSEMPVDEDYRLDENITEPLELPSGAGIEAGRYPVVRNGPVWQILMSIYK